ncbi:MAG: CsgG/HfaB family protein [Bacteroidales bacterium]
MIRTTSYTLLLLSLLAQACMPMMKQPMKTSGARLGERSGVYEELVQLPEPQEPVVVAVYKFRDQTGQYKPSETGASWSTAVTQGATAILIQSLEESGWFIPIEREGLGNLLNERKIIRSSRVNYGGQDAESSDLLPPLLFAGMILEGGIVSYESNVLTGGAGLRYFGTGGSGQYREDRVTIYLRAISTSTGRILKTVHTTKTILSQKMDAGVFRYVSLKRLLEAEVGFTYNEPSGIAVQEAIDKAVHAMIMEGILDNLWTTLESNPLEQEAVKNYVTERDEADHTDHLGYRPADLRTPFALGFSSGVLLYDGDYPNSLPGPKGSLRIGFFQDSPWSADLQLGMGKLAVEDPFSSFVHYGKIATKYRIYNDHRFTPYVEAGLGALISTGNRLFDYENVLSDQSYLFLHSTLGWEFMAGPKTGIDLRIGYNWMWNDRIDGMAQGRYNDYFWEAMIGLNLYIK